MSVTDRSFVDWLTPRGHRQYGYEPSVPPPAEPIAFDVYGEWHEHDPQEARITPATARAAAREYLLTRQRPTCVQWETG